MAKERFQLTPQSPSINVQATTETGMQVNLVKSELCTIEVTFLGFSLKTLVSNPPKGGSKLFSRSYHLTMSRKREDSLEWSTTSRTTFLIMTKLWSPSHCWQKSTNHSSGRRNNRLCSMEPSSRVIYYPLYPNPSKPLIIYPDASQKYAMGKMVKQLNGTEEIISAFLQIFNDAQV